VIAGVVALMPLVAAGASWVADVVGVLAGAIVGVALMRVAARR